MAQFAPPCLPCTTCLSLFVSQPFPALLPVLQVRMNPLSSLPLTPSCSSLFTSLQVALPRGQWSASPTLRRSVAGWKAMLEVQPAGAGWGGVRLRKRFGSGERGDKKGAQCGNKIDRKRAKYGAIIHSCCGEFRGWPPPERGPQSGSTAGQAGKHALGDGRHRDPRRAADRLSSRAGYYSPVSRLKVGRIWPGCR